MKSILEKELSDILEKIYYNWKKGDIILQEVHKLYFSAKDKYLTAQEREKNEETSELILKILFLTGRISEEFIEKWQGGKITPSDKELELLKEGCEEVLKVFDSHFKRELIAYQGKSFNEYHTEVKEKIEKIRKLISTS